MKNKLYYAVGVAILALVLFVGWMQNSVQPVSGAPAAIPTPVAASLAGGKAVPQLVTFFDRRAIAADTTSPCVDLGAYEKADFVWVIDQGTVNTTTLTLKFGNVTSQVYSGLALVSANALDATSGNEFQVFHRYTCVLADVANSNTITISLNAWVR